MKLECSYVQLPKIYSYLNGNEFKVFTVLFDEWAMMKNEDGWFYRSQKMLSEDSGLPLRTLQRTLKKLIEKGVILTTFYNDGVKMATYNKANEYKINLEVVYKLCKKGVKMTTEGCQNGVPSKDIKTKNNITIPVEQTPVVIETEREIKNINPVEQIPVESEIKEKKENEMNERSECNEMNATNGMSVVNGMNENEVKRNETQSSSKAYTPKVRPSSSETSNKATCDVQTPKMEQLPTEEEKVQQDANKCPQTEREAKIASIMSNIEINKEAMFKAKSQMQFDAHFQDFKRNMSNLKHLVSEDAYKNYRSTQGNWWKATVKYLIWYKDPNKKPTKPTKPTDEQMGNYHYHLDSMRIAQKIEDLENALNRMSNWFEKMEALYTKTVMQQYWQNFERDCASIKKSNPIFEEWQKKINQPS